MTENINTKLTLGPSPFPLRAIRGLWRLLVERPYRHAVWLYLVRPRGVFQPFNNTQRDRYPQVFSFVQSVLGRDSPIKILSYGCSTGEEVFSLRQYFPDAVIKGIDINPVNIAVCRRMKSPDANISFTLQTAPRPNHQTATMQSSAWPCCAWQPRAARRDALRPSHPLRRFCRDCRFQTLPQARRTLRNTAQQFPFVRRSSRICFRDGITARA